MENKDLARRLVRLAGNIIDFNKYLEENPEKAPKGDPAAEKLKEVERLLKSSKTKYENYLKKYVVVSNIDFQTISKDQFGFTIKVLIKVNNGNIEFDLYCKYEWREETFNFFLHDAFAYFNRRKYRLFKSKFVDIDEKDLTKPEKLFPPKRMSKIFSEQSRSGDSMKPRDFLMALKREYDSEMVDKETVKIPLGGEYSLILYRYTFMRTSAWGVNGIYQKYKRIDKGKTVTIPESEEGLDMIKDLYREYQRKYA